MQQQEADPKAVQKSTTRTTLLTKNQMMKLAVQSPTSLILKSTRYYLRPRRQEFIRPRRRLAKTKVLTFQHTHFNASYGVVCSETALSEGYISRDPVEGRDERSLL
jgi:hypothetical protein